MSFVPTSSGSWGAAPSTASELGEPGAGPRAVSVSRGWRVTAWIAVGVSGILGVLALRSGEPLLAELPPCALRHVFHIGCATCGFARAAVHLAQGDVAASWMLHPLAVIVALQGVLGWAAWGAGLLRRRPVFQPKWWTRAMVATAAATMVLWLVRLVFGIVPI